MNEQKFGMNPVKINETENHDFIKEENKIVKPEVSYLESDNRILMEDSDRLELEEDSVRSEETMNLNDTNSPQRGYSTIRGVDLCVIR